MPAHDPGTGGGPFVSLSEESSIETEATVAGDGQGNVVAAWNAIASTRPQGVEGSDWHVGYAVSGDDGDTWRAPQLAPRTPDDPYSTDPVLKASPAGDLWLVWGQGTWEAGDTDIVAARLDVATGTFEDPVVVDGGNDLLDKPWFTFGAAGRMIVSYVRRPTAGAALEVVVATSIDGGAFDPVVVRTATPGTAVAIPRVCTDPGDDAPDAPLYATYQETPNLNPRLWVSTSTDGGASWLEREAPVATDHVFQDAPCVARGDDLWIAYARGSEQGFEGSVTHAGDAAVVLVSHDRGVTFDPVTVLDGPAVLLPELVVTSDGHLHLAAFQGPAEGAATVVLATSEDAGVTWTSTELPSAGTMSECRLCGCFLGDYLGLAAVGDTVLLAYPTNEAVPGRSHVRFASWP